MAAPVSVAGSATRTSSAATAGQPGAARATGTAPGTTARHRVELQRTGRQQPGRHDTAAGDAVGDGPGDHVTGQMRRASIARLGATRPPPMLGSPCRASGVVPGENGTASQVRSTTTRAGRAAGRTGQNSNSDTGTRMQPSAAPRPERPDHSLDEMMPVAKPPMRNSPNRR